MYRLLSQNETSYGMNIVNLRTEQQHGTNNLFYSALTFSSRILCFFTLDNLKQRGVFPF